MTIDRLLIICSLIELAYFGYKVGVSHFTLFQWVACVLLTVKLILALHNWHRRAR